MALTKKKAWEKTERLEGHIALEEYAGINPKKKQTERKGNAESGGCMTQGRRSVYGKSTGKMGENSSLCKSQALIHDRDEGAR